MRKPVTALSRRRFLGSAALLATPALLPIEARGADVAENDALPGVACRAPWAQLEAYDADRFGPLLAVSDEGDNARAIARAAYASAKARALNGRADTVSTGVMIDGERMVSAGESPIGPDEYVKLIPAAVGRTYCSTNVGVHANAKLQRLLPEFAFADAAAGEAAWLARVFAAFAPFVHTPDGVPRPLTVRLVVQAQDAPATIRRLVAALEAGRAQGLLGPQPVHRFALLCIVDGPIAPGAPVDEIERVLGIAARAGVGEVAIDGDLTAAARERTSVASLLNVVDVETLRVLFAAARQNGVRLVYRYQVDVDSAARTIWTGLRAARSYGLSAGKYGLLPLTLEEQERAMTLVSGWTAGWSTVPACYLDTPLVTVDDVYDDARVPDAVSLWMQRARAAGARLALFDCPDLYAKRHLLRDARPGGVLTLEQVAALDRRGKTLGLKPMWSGGLTPRQAFALGALRVFAIFCTGYASQQVAVHGSFTDDPDLSSEIAPTEVGVRRVHAALQAGFLNAALGTRTPALASDIAIRAEALLAVIDAKRSANAELAALDAALVRGWTAHWMS